MAGTQQEGVGGADGHANGTSPTATRSPSMCPEPAAAAAADARSRGPACVEVFVGGLPGDATDDGVRAAFEAVGPVDSVRISRRKKNGEAKAGFVRFRDETTAERACAEVKEVAGQPVGVHILRARAGGDSAAGVEQQGAAGEDDDLVEAGVGRLLRAIRSHSDRRGAVAAALRAVGELQAKSRGSSSSRSAERAGREGGSDGSGGSGGEDGGASPAEPAPPDPATFLEAYPRCKRLVDTFRGNPNTHNKTPLAILHEYATRLSLEFVYNETAESNLGPFTVEAKLTSVGGAVLYATGQGRGRGKKDAKQVAAAAVLEQLLGSVPEADFLQPGKAKIMKVQVNPRSIPPTGNGRAGLLLRGRGRGRWVLGRSGRPTLEFAPSGLPGYGGGGGALTTGGEYGQFTPTFAPVQEAYESIEAFGLPSLSNDAKVRGFVAATPVEAELLRSLRGHSLDASALTSIQRQLAGLPPMGQQDVALGSYGNSRSFDNSRFSFRPSDAEQHAALQQQLAGQMGGGAPVGTLPGLPPQALGPGYGLQQPPVLPFTHPPY